MKHMALAFCLLSSLTCIQAQTSITTLNLIQAGAVPKMLQDKKQLSNSGLTFNFSNFNQKGFTRIDATWLLRKLVNGQGDSTQKDSTFKLAGMDLPVFTATFGRNLYYSPGFSIGLGINLDSRTLFADPGTKSKAIIDAINTGIVVGTKIRLASFITYTGLVGYDFMFSNNKDIENGRQFYAQNNISVLAWGKIGFNIQPDITFKSFRLKDLGNATMVNKNIKVGISYAIP